MNKDLKIIDPYKIEEKDCPVFVIAGDMRSFLGFGIRLRTKSNWNHSMIIRRPGFFCSQNLVYKEIPMKKYVTKSNILKFWVCKDIAEDKRNAILIKIKHDLNKSWLKRLYDPIGIIGHLFGIRWFNIPELNYCSERVAGKLRVLLPKLQAHPTPEEVDTALKDSKRMEILGYSFGLDHIDNV